MSVKNFSYAEILEITCKKVYQQAIDDLVTESKAGKPLSKQTIMKLRSLLPPHCVNTLNPQAKR